MSCAIFGAYLASKFTRCLSKIQTELCSLGFSWLNLASLPTEPTSGPPFPSPPAVAQPRGRPCPGEWGLGLRKPWHVQGQQASRGGACQPLHPGKAIVGRVKKWVCRSIFHHTHTGIHVQAHTYKHTQAHTYTCTHMCYALAHTCRHTQHTRTHWHTRIHVCMHICSHTCTQVHTGIHTSSHMHTRMCAHTHVSVCRLALCAGTGIQELPGGSQGANELLQGPEEMRPCRSDFGWLMKEARPQQPLVTV